MKKTILILTLAIVANISAFAQNFPYGINYQAVARDANGNAQVNQQVPVQFTIYKIAESSGNIIYQERQLKQTNSMGQFNAVIGKGTPVIPYNAASFSQINWSTDSTFLKVELNANISFTGTFTAMGPTTRFQSVPYSMLAAKVIEKQNLTLTGSTLALSGSTPPSVTIDPSSTNELPAAGNGISVSGNTVSVKSVNDYAVFEHQENPGVDGGSCVSTDWQIRNLNTQVVNVGTAIAPLANQTITLQPGTYYIKGYANAFRCDEHQIALVKTIANPQLADYVLIGTSSYTNSGETNSGFSYLDGYITITAQTSYYLKHYTETSRIGDGLGFDVDAAPGLKEVYARIVIQKIN